MSSWNSYPKIFNLGHRAVQDLLNYPHVIEEKVDGSQFSFGVFFDAKTGGKELRVRSKGAQMHPDAPEKMFTKGVETAKRLASNAAADAGLGLKLDWTYRGEYLSKPKPNALHYDRVPAGHVIIFDVSTGDEQWLTPEQKAAEANRLGLEFVPVLAIDTVGGQTRLEQLRLLIDQTQSCLGGQLIEGIVIKPLGPLFGIDGKTLMGKFVSERFREVHKTSWRELNPTRGDIVQKLIQDYGTLPRYNKAIQHLREAGQLTDSPADIGKLIIEVRKDVGQECKDEIKQILWKHFWPQIERGITQGLPQHYKDELLRRQFEQEPVAGPTSISEFMRGQE